MASKISLGKVADAGIIKFKIDIKIYFQSGKAYRLKTRLMIHNNYPYIARQSRFFDVPVPIGQTHFDK